MKFWTGFFGVCLWAALAILPIGCKEAEASPVIVCDPQAGVTSYQITGDPYWADVIVAQPDGSIRTDVGNIAVGPHNIQVKACNELWGCSDPAPFSFVRPNLVAPTAIMLKKQ